jgi:hypothetical protein
MGKWLLIATGVVVATVVVAVVIGQAQENARAEGLAARLIGSTTPSANGTVAFESLSDLPTPVARYFRHVLTDGQNMIASATIEQSGVLRTSIATDRWSPFTATQHVVPSATGFLWDARVELPLATHVRVLDSYVAGNGYGRVSLLSAVAVASEAGRSELNSGALHRYLAEGVWFPTALLPQAGVVWTPIDELSALATLTNHGTSVSLEFRFNDIGEVTGIFSDGRFGNFGGEYRRTPWQGHFEGYQVRAGMRIPSYGEVGWYDSDVLHLVWKGRVVAADYELAA